MEFGILNNIENNIVNLYNSSYLEIKKRYFDDYLLIICFFLVILFIYRFFSQLCLWIVGRVEYIFIHDWDG